MKQRILAMLLFGLLGITPALAQEREITGKVTDKNGEPIPGVAVLVVETQQGNSTDIDGNYKVKASVGNTLKFSYVNYKTQEVKVAESTAINVKLEEDNLLDEIVVSSYRSLEREKFTGAITSVSTKVIEQVPIGSFDQILQGRASGVMISASSGRPGAAANVRIRGVGSINAATDPLYILDGVPIAPNDFAALNPNDFESVNVLKDAAATAIYGSRAANGVILITSKKGKAGKMQVVYRTQFGLNTRTSERFDMMNSSEKIQFEKMMFDQGVVRGSAGAIYNNTSLTPAQKSQRLDELAQTNTDWRDYFFRTSQQQSHELNFSGGTEKARFYVAGNFRREEGVLVNSSLDRYSLRANVDFSPTERFRGGVNFTLGHTKENLIDERGNNLNNPVLFAFVGNPYSSPYNPDGSYAATVDGTINLYQSLIEQYNVRKPSQIKVVGNTFLEYDLPWIKGLTVKTSLGLDYTQDLTNQIGSPLSPNQSGIPLTSGFLSRNYFQEQSFITTNTLRYNKTFGGDKHNISAIIGNELIQRYFFTTSATGYGLDPRLPFPVTTNNQAATTFTNRETRNALVSYFGDLAYSFDNRYNLSVSLRRDGSSRFGQNKRFAWFWSTGASWNIHNEKFYENLGGLSTILSSANLRLSYGTTGNQEVLNNTLDGANFQYLVTFAPSVNYNGVGTIAPSSLGNPDFQWEQSRTANIAMDMGFLKNRVKFTVEYYDRLTTALFVPTQISRTTGFPSITYNTGGMSNKGLELMIDADVLKIGKFTWNVNANATFNKNRVEDLGPGVEEYIDANENIIKVGEPIRHHYLVRWAGVNPADGTSLYYDKEGNVAKFSTSYRVPMGTFEPPRYGGFTNTFSYKNFELSVFFSWAQGFTLFNNNRFFSENPGGFGNFNQSRSMLNMWTTPGQLTNIPKATEPNNFEDSRFLEPGDFLRLRNLLLSYTLNGDAVKNMRISSARIYIQAQNLATFTRYNGFDPEATSQDSVLSNYPVPRVYMIGLDLNF